MQVPIRSRVDPDMEISPGATRAGVGTGRAHRTIGRRKGTPGSARKTQVDGRHRANVPFSVLEWGGLTRRDGNGPATAVGVEHNSVRYSRLTPSENIGCRPVSDASLPSGSRAGWCGRNQWP